MKQARGTYSKGLEKCVAVTVNIGLYRLAPEMDLLIQTTGLSGM